MGCEYPFEKLMVWQECRLPVKEIYQLTSAYPESEKYGVVSQTKGCVIIAGSNIAEGSSGRSGNNQAHFYQMALSSLLNY